MQRMLAITLALSGLLMFVIAGQSQASAQGADDASQLEAGKAVYETSCAGCHGDGGEGVAGVGRPLTDIASQGDRATHIASITNGKGSMPGFGERLSAEEIEQSASYVRLAFVSAEVTSDEELALTGVGSAGLAVAGVTMLAGGLQLVVWSKRRTDV